MSVRRKDKDGAECWCKSLFCHWQKPKDLRAVKNELEIKKGSLNKNKIFASYLKIFDPPSDH